MKHLVFFVLLISLTLPACGESDSKNTSGKESGTSLATKADGPMAGSDSNQGPSSKKKELSGEVISDIIKDGGPALGGKLSLERGHGNEITGRIDLEGSVFLLRGIKESNNLRLWVSNDAVKPAEIRRGYLFGEVQGDKYVGNFAVSGNGGEPLTRGKWKTNSVFDE